MGFEANEREPELPSLDDSKSPVLGGSRRIWPSVSAYLMSQQHPAHRAGDMQRVWALRRMRHSIRQKLLRRQIESVRTGAAVEPLTEEDALSANKRELRETEEELAQYTRWERTRCARQLE